MQIALLSWIALLSLMSFGAMGFDKQQAVKKGHRISEKRLWQFALFGGGIGGFLGMYLFKHKTKKWSFRLGFSLLALFYGWIIIVVIQNV